MNAIEVNGVKLHFEENGTGPTVVLVHGIPTDYRVWRHQVDELSAHYRTISYSRRCAFPNQFNDYASSTIENNTADLEGLITKLESGPVHLIGHSYGGPIVALYTLRHPEMVRSLVLVEPDLPAIIIADSENTMDKLSLFIRKPSIGLSGLKAINNIKKTQQEVSCKNLENALDIYYSNTWEDKKVKIQLSESNRVMMLDNMETFYELLTPSPTFNREDAKKIAAPTLIVCGEYDFKFMKAVNMELHKLIPNNQLAIIQNASHYPHIENPEECSAKILAFFSQITMDKNARQETLST